MATDIKYKPYTSTRNACKLCTPLGACVAFKGIKACVPLIHGSQGCATYIRRYMISHYREPVDIASTSFSEEATVFGGNKLFNTSIDNIIEQYHPEVIAISSTCLSETIGEDVPKLIREYKALNHGKSLPEFVFAPTPSYKGTHLDGFHEAVLSMVKTFAVAGKNNNSINLFPGFLSPEDLRYLKDIMEDFRLNYNLLPDYSTSLDNPNWENYKRIPEGGVPLEKIKQTGRAKASIEFGYLYNKGIIPGKINGSRNHNTAGEFLEDKFSIVNYQPGIPIGIKNTDVFFGILKIVAGKDTPDRHKAERGRLIDAYVDAHKYVFGKRAILYGEEDLVIALFGFLEEIGIDTVVIASGANSGKLSEKLSHVTSRDISKIQIISGGDFETIREFAEELKPDLLIGNSKAYYIARKLKIPLVRIGFPVHDRFGSQRIMHIGYKGTQQLFDRIVNALIEYKQEYSSVGYKYI